MRQSVPMESTISAKQSSVHLFSCACSPGCGALPWRPTFITNKCTSSPSLFSHLPSPLLYFLYSFCDCSVSLFALTVYSLSFFHEAGNCTTLPGDHSSSHSDSRQRHTFVCDWDKQSCLSSPSTSSSSSFRDNRIAMDFAMEDTQNVTRDVHESSKLSQPPQRNDSQSVTKRFVAPATHSLDASESPAFYIYRDMMSEWNTQTNPICM